MASNETSTIVRVELVVGLPLVPDRPAPEGVLSVRNTILELEGIVQQYGGTLTIQEATFA